MERAAAAPPTTRPTRRRWTASSSRSAAAASTSATTSSRCRPGSSSAASIRRASQATFLPHPDGLISNNQTTEKYLFGESGKISATPPAKPKAETSPAGSKDAGHAKDEHQDKPGPAQEPAHPQYEAIARNFKSAIPGSTLTWHQALFLPSWGRHVKPSDVTNASMDTVLANIEKQAAALQKVSDHFGKAIHVHCWLRPPAYNKQIGGASNSAHLRGTATDFHMDGITAE
ncbi:MAG TPA: D-Ala-D-Ala carboxypeptidase family metallohydrolase, partial [Kofleriaceae bacterium]